MDPVFIRPARSEDGPRILAMLENLASFEGAAHPPRSNLIAMANDVFTLAPKLTILVAEGEAHVLLGFVSYFENYSSWEGTAGVHIGDLGSSRMHDRGVLEQHSSVTLFLFTDQSESMSL